MFEVAGGTGSVVGGDSVRNVGVGTGFEESGSSGVTDGIGEYLFDDFVRARAPLIPIVKTGKELAVLSSRKL